MICWNGRNDAPDRDKSKGRETMSSYQIAVCEDNTTQSEYVTELVKAWAQQRQHMVHISAFESAESFLFRYAEDKSFDILLLDIEMGKMSGVELAKQIRRENREVQIIFITGYMDYIAEGYDVEALHYLLKPLSAEKLCSVLDRAVMRVRDQEHCILLRIGDEMVRIPLYEIRYLEVQKNYVTIHAEKDYEVKKPLRELEKELDGSFFKTGRSYWVNLRYVMQTTKQEAVLKDGTKVPLSRGLYEALNRAIIGYFQ